MSKETKEGIFTELKLQWQEEYRKVQRYRFLLRNAEKRKAEIEKQIKALL